VHLEQLTLFEVEAVPVADDIFEPELTVAPVAPRPARRRRRAWLPRLIRWLKARPG
jgi:hypothetical protein